MLGVTEITFLTKIAMFEDIFDEESNVSAIEAEELFLHGGKNNSMQHCQQVSVLLGVRARSAETLLYLLGFLLLLLFRRRTNRAAQTVEPRDLKLGQIVELNLGRTYQSLSPIGS